MVQFEFNYIYYCLYVNEPHIRLVLYIQYDTRDTLIMNNYIFTLGPFSNATLQ